MKRTPKTTKKKLNVNTETVRVLTDELRAAAGGQPPVSYPCSGGHSGCLNSIGCE